MYAISRPVALIVAPVANTFASPPRGDFDTRMVFPVAMLKRNTCRPQLCPALSAVRLLARPSTDLPLALI